MIIADTGIFEVSGRKWSASIALEPLDIQTCVVASDEMIAIRRELLPYCLFVVQIVQVMVHAIGS